MTEKSRRVKQRRRLFPQVVDEDGPMDPDGGDGGGKKGSSNDDKADKVSIAKTRDGNILGGEEKPDIFDVDLPGLDSGLTPLEYAVVFGAVGVVDEPIAAGAGPL